MSKLFLRTLKELWLLLCQHWALAGPTLAEDCWGFLQKRPGPASPLETAPAWAGPASLPTHGVLAKLSVLPAPLSDTLHGTRGWCDTLGLHRPRRPGRDLVSLSHCHLHPELVPCVCLLLELVPSLHRPGTSLWPGPADQHPEHPDVLRKFRTGEQEHRSRHKVPTQQQETYIVFPQMSAPGEETEPEQQWAWINSTQAESAAQGQCCACSSWSVPKQNNQSSVHTESHQGFAHPSWLTWLTVSVSLPLTNCQDPPSSDQQTFRNAHI